MDSHPPEGGRVGAGRFSLHQVIDPQHNGVVASVFEYPEGWQAQSHVVWKFENVSQPVIAYARVFDPRGRGSFEFLPTEFFFWIEEGRGFYEQGQLVMGQAFLPPMPAGEAMTRWVVPKYRGNRRDLAIGGVGPAPRLAQRLGLDLGAAPCEEVCVRLRYTDEGVPLEEEFYGVKVSADVPYYGPQGMMTQVNWGFARLFCFRSEAGALDALRETFWRVAGSVKVNPLWEKLYAQVLRQLKAQFDQYIQAGYSQIQAAAQLSNSISANNDYLLDSFEQQRRAASRSSAPAGDSSARDSGDAFDEYVRGVETFKDPYQGESQQDYNYQYHWTNGSGEYQHSNDPFFNPNAGSSQSWTLMEPKKS